VGLFTTSCQCKNDKPKLQDESPLSSILVIQAKGADFIPDPRNPTEGTLTLRFVSPCASFISTQPDQRPQNLTIQEAVSCWQKGELGITNNRCRAGFFQFKESNGQSNKMFSLWQPIVEMGGKHLTFEVSGWKESKLSSTTHLSELTLFVECCPNK
jgi:hypothetical protein